MKVLFLMFSSSFFYYQTTANLCGERDQFKDENGICQKCPSCPAGFESFCEWGYLQKCKQCKKGTFKDYGGHYSCKRCKDCDSDNRYEFWPCTMVQNSVCGSCKVGFYENSSSIESKCIPCEESSDHTKCNDVKVLKSTTKMVIKTAITRLTTTTKKTSDNTKETSFLLDRKSLILISAITCVMLVVAVFGVISIFVSCIKKSTSSEPGNSISSADLRRKCCKRLAQICSRKEKNQVSASIRADDIEMTSFFRTDDTIESIQPGTIVPHSEFEPTATPLTGFLPTIPRHTRIEYCEDDLRSESQMTTSEAAPPTELPRTFI